MTPLQVLQHYFGYSEFRPGQVEIINSIIAGDDVLAILPTSGGKSLCFQVPGLVLGGTTLVISPLISLMRDQVLALQQRSISATYLNSSLDQSELSLRLKKLAAGEFQFVYLAPERLRSSSFTAALEQVNMPLVVIDEAHCTSLWGHDFRPSYLEIAQWILSLPTKPRVSAFTATATPSVKADMLQHLGLERPKVFANSFWRRNLRLWVARCSSTNQQMTLLFRVLNRHQNQAGIIYTLTRRKAEELVQVLKRWSPELSIAAYHGGLDNQLRAEIQDRYLRNELRIIVATNAFGMGVDKPNVRWVFHWQLPSNLENYYQEAGRAGRDGAVADCYLCPNPQDFLINLEFIKRASPQRLPLELAKFNTCVGYAYTTNCLTATILEYFGEALDHNCQRCQNCLEWQLNSLRGERQTYQELDRKRQNLANQYQTHHNFVLTQEQLLLAAASLSCFKLSQPWHLIAGLGWGWHQWWAAGMQTTNQAPPHGPPVQRLGVRLDA